ncbi:hypothetical protein LXL04_027000 [Taraxacum kok-saghyz]
MSWTILKYERNTSQPKIKEALSLLVSRHFDYGLMNYCLSDKSETHTGFYIAVLETNRGMVTTCAVSIHDNELAEVPYVATKEMYENKGFCKILMAQVEEKLKELNVKKIVLHSKLINRLGVVWNSLGFSPMTESAEKLVQGKYKLVPFDDVILWQKVL